MIKTPEDDKKLLNRYFLMICFAALFTGMCMQMLNSNLAPFANDVLHSKSLAGYLATAFSAGSIPMAFFCGWMVNSKGRRNSYVLGCLLFGLPTLACAFWPTPTFVLAARFIQGMAKSVVTVAATSIVSDVIPRARMSEGMGLYGLGGTLTMAFGPMLALALTADKNYFLMFVVCGVLYMSACFIGFGLNYENKPAYAEEIAAKKQLSANAENAGYKGIWKWIERKAIPASLNFTVYFSSTCSILVFITVYSQEILAYTGAQIGMFYMVAAAVMFVTRLTMARVADKYGALRVLLPGHLGVMVMYLLLIFFSAQSYLVYLTIGGLYGYCSASVTPVFNAAAVVDSPKARNGTASATFAFLMDFGPLASTTVFGLVIDMAASPTFGYRNVFLISIGINLLSLTMSFFLFNKRARSRRLAKAELPEMAAARI